MHQWTAEGGKTEESVQKPVEWQGKPAQRKEGDGLTY